MAKPKKLKIINFKKIFYLSMFIIHHYLQTD